MIRTVLLHAGMFSSAQLGRTLLCCAALLGLVCGSFQSLAGEAALAPPPAPPCPASAIAAKVVELVYDPVHPFDAARYGDCSVGSAASCGSPPQGQPLPSGTTYPSDLAGAFSIAPLHLQTALCALDRIYIVRNPNLQSINPGPWGMRDLRNGGKRHIGLPEALWTNPAINKPGIPIASYESAVLDLLLNGWFTKSGSSFSATPDGDSRVKFLGILAHEMSHIFWYADDIEDTQCPISTPSGATVYRYFHVLSPLYSWKPKPGMKLVKRGFHRFDDDQGNTNTYGTWVTSIANAMAQGQNSGLYAVYAFGHFASLFSLVAPDEDFAETYKLWAITQAAPNLTFTITVPVNNKKLTATVKPPPVKTHWVDLWTQKQCTVPAPAGGAGSH